MTTYLGKRISHETGVVLDAVYWTNCALKRMFGKKATGHEVFWGHRDCYRNEGELAIKGKIFTRNRGRNGDWDMTWEINACHPLDSPTKLKEIVGYLRITATREDEVKVHTYTHRELEKV